MLTMRTLTLAALSAAALAMAQRNITVANTDPGIRYGGENITNPKLCWDNSTGSVIVGQAGCFNLDPPSCAASITVGRGNDTSASFTFQGSAIYINAALFQYSPLYTVTLDGEAEDVDGFRQRGPTCVLLFSRTGLDPNADHRITLSTKSHSPQRNATESDTPLVFTLTSIIYTTENSTAPSSEESTSPPTGTEPSSTGEGAGEPDEGAGVARDAPLSIALASAFALVLSHL